MFITIPEGALIVPYLKHSSVVLPVVQRTLLWTDESKLC